MSVNYSNGKIDLSKDKFLVCIQELRSVTASLCYHHKMLNEYMNALDQLMYSMKHEIKKNAIR